MGGRSLGQSIHQVMCRRRLDSAIEDQLCHRMPAVGSVFGSPDFERLMAEDYRLGRGCSILQFVRPSGQLVCILQTLKFQMLCRCSPGCRLTFGVGWS